MIRLKTLLSEQLPWMENYGDINIYDDDSQSIITIWDTGTIVDMNALNKNEKGQTFFRIATNHYGEREFVWDAKRPNEFAEWTGSRKGEVHYNKKLTDLLKRKHVKPFHNPDAMFSQNADTDSIDDTINYKAVAKRLIQFVQDSEYQLVETLAEECTRIIREEFGVSWVKLSLNKTGALRGSRDVGITIERGNA